ncbi:MAG: type IV secretory system conjugative DNA transfer family protein [Lachnospiraceae bacterium]|nr:type IV secretory system conjugative DNA transfer family protein [Lachnospiraceae bacterium]
MKQFELNTPKERKWRTKNSNDKFTDKSILFRFNLLIGNPIFLTVLYFLILISGFLLLNYLFNSLYNILDLIKYIFRDTTKISFSEIFAADNFITFYSKGTAAYIILAIIIAVADAVLIVKINNSYKDFNVGQKGAERFAKIEELREQYKAIPLKNNIWESATGGVIITRDGDNFLVDEEPGHNLIIGTTRSGKDQMFVEPNIEINSRCTCKPSFIIIDPKSETYRHTRRQLNKRGYLDILINLLDPDFSDRINPFSRIIELYKKGDKDNAYKEARSFAYSIFWNTTNDNGNDENSTWNNAANDIFTALIIANVSDCIELDIKEKAEAQYEFIRKQKAFSDLTNEKQKMIADQFASGELNTSISEYIPMDFTFEFEPKHEKEINIFSIINMFRLLAEAKDENGISALDKYFTARPSMDMARRFFATAKIPHARTSTSIYFTMLSKLNGFAFDNIGRMTSCSDFELKDIGFGEKPIALFIAVPDYDNSNHFLITAIIQQIYYVLSAEATKTQNGKCKRPVWHYINEFGNCPPFSHIAQMVSMGAGRGIFYNFIIQDYAQMDERYNEKIAKTIKNNCHNQFFIKTMDYSTAEEFSKLLGKETITNLDRIGRRFAIDKTFTERKEDQELLNANRLMDLLEGEMIVKRIMKRKTISGEDAIPYPIFNTGENKIPFSYKYLSDTFDGDVTLNDVRSQWPQKIDINNFTFDIIAYYKNHIKSFDEVQQRIESYSCYGKILTMFIEDDIRFPIDAIKLSPEIELINKILNLDIPEERKQQYFSIIEEARKIKNLQYAQITS